MSDILDRVVFDDLIEHIGAEAAQAIIELFIGECRELVAAMGAPGATHDAARRAAHSLKSSAGQLGAAALAEAALAVEAASETGAADLPARIRTLTDCAAHTEAALAQVLQ
jgi:HPt (histidine-containing phosphotransfer) domain-containing protein